MKHRCFTCANRVKLWALNYPRHFLVLSCVMVALVMAGRWVPPAGVVASFGLYGALHAATLALAVRPPQAIGRKLSFIAIAAASSMATVSAGLHLSPVLAALTGKAGPAVTLTLAAGVGAVGYAVLVRLFWMRNLSGGSIVTIALGCMLVALLTLEVAVRSQATRTLWFALSWWLAFSTGLWLSASRTSDHPAHGGRP